MSRYRDPRTGRFISAASARRRKPENVRKVVTRARKSKPKRSARKTQTAKVSSPIEYVLHFDYGTKKARNLVRFQLHIIGPEVPDREAIRIIQEWEGTGRLPKGWTAKLIRWGRGENVSKRFNRGEDRRMDRLFQSALSTKGHVTRKHPV